MSPKTSSIPRFDLAAFFTAPEPCEDALLKLGEAYNKLADQVEEAWAVLDSLLDHAERIQEHVPKSEHWYAVRDGARRIVR